MVDAEASQLCFCCLLQAQAHVTVKGASDKAGAAELADKEQTILELRETNEVVDCRDCCCRQYSMSLAIIKSSL